MARGWIGAPIGITVEGANILTRTLIVFGQSALRSHPHARDLLRTAEVGETGRFLPSSAAGADGSIEPLALLEEAFELAIEAEPLLARLRASQKVGDLPAGPPETILSDAVAAGALGAAEAEVVRRAAERRREATRVDDFDPAEPASRLGRA